jgi:hypothetical protein
MLHWCWTRVAQIVSADAGHQRVEGDIEGSGVAGKKRWGGAFTGRRSKE